MFKYLLILSLLLVPNLVFAESCKDCHTVIIKMNEEVIVTARNYLGVREKTNHNDNTEIDKWLKNCGLGKGYSYCAAYTVYMYKETFEKYKLKSPLPNTAGVARFAEYSIKHPFDFKVISTKKMKWNIDQPQTGDLISWGHGRSFTSFNYMGHQGITIKPLPKTKVQSIEGNTKASEGGDQSGTKLGDFTGGQEGVYILSLIHI